MKSAQYYSHWAEHDGKTVVINGAMHRIRVNTIHAVYPCNNYQISVFAEPINKRSAHYLMTKEELGDDWSLDVLELDVEQMTEIEEQCNNLSGTA
jgi:hypothetical protein